MPGFTGPPFQVREAHVDAEPDQLRADARRLQRGPTEQDQLRAQEEPGQPLPRNAVKHKSRAIRYRIY